MIDKATGVALAVRSVDVWITAVDALIDTTGHVAPPMVAVVLAIVASSTSPVIPRAHAYACWLGILHLYRYPIWVIRAPRACPL